jgi:hypothetical protein
MIHGGLLQDAACTKLDVLYAMHLIAGAWKLVTLITIKNCFAVSGFPVDHVYSNDDNTLKLNEDEEMTGIVCNLLKCSLRTT